jgi:hypothetical protein
MSWIRMRLSYANVMATLAVFLALGGGAVAATQLSKNSVGTSQLRNGAVTPKKLSPAAKPHVAGVPGPPGQQGVQGIPGPKGDPGNANTGLATGLPATVEGGSGIVFGSIPILPLNAAQLTIAIKADQLQGPAVTLSCTGSLELSDTGDTRTFAFPPTVLSATASDEVELTNVQLIEDTPAEFQNVTVGINCDLTGTPATSVRLLPLVGVVALGESSI